MKPGPESAITFAGSATLYLITFADNVGYLVDIIGSRWTKKINEDVRKED